MDCVIIRKVILSTMAVKSNTQDFFVRVSCMTFNQSNYIIDALNGFVMQQTNFPFVCTVVDDASTDGEQEVIRNYMREYFDLQDSFVAYEKDTDYGHVTFAQHKTNKNCYFAAIYLKENHYSQKKSKAPYLAEWKNTKYIALCEGDDYWTDPLKLQKQVGYLEEHRVCSMCFHKATIIKEIDNPVWLCCDAIEDKDYSATELFERWIVPTCSIVYRKDVNDFRIKNNNNILNGDIFLVEKCAHCGVVHGMKDEMSVYRIQPNGVTYDFSRKQERIIRYPKHYKELKSDFRQIDKRVINTFIGRAYFRKSEIMENPLSRYWNIAIGALYCPDLLLDKMCKVRRRILNRIKNR